MCSAEADPEKPNAFRVDVGKCLQELEGPTNVLDLFKLQTDTRWSNVGTAMPCRLKDYTRSSAMYSSVVANP